eukprot:109933_1
MMSESEAPPDPTVLEESRSSPSTAWQNSSIKNLLDGTVQTKPMYLDSANAQTDILESRTTKLQLNHLKDGAKVNQISLKPRCSNEEPPRHSTSNSKLKDAET